MPRARHAGLGVSAPSHRTRNAALTSAFGYVQYALALTGGLVLFPIVVDRLGAYDNGLWLITGELVGYILLGDLGVLSVLPWLVAAKSGEQDRDAIAQYLADGLAVGLVIGSAFVALALAIDRVDGETLGIAPAAWRKVSLPLAIMLALTGLGLPLRVFTAVLTGLQDVSFLGATNLALAALTVTFTATAVVSGHGMVGLAFATAVPPVLGGLAAAGRTIATYPGATRRWYHPSARGCLGLLHQGFGGLLGALGTRLLMASSGLVFGALGRPDLATIYAATSKVAQSGQPLCCILPDSALVGLSQIHGQGDPHKARQAVQCVALLYLCVPGVLAVALLAGNPWFVRAWLGADYYASNYVNALVALNLVAAILAGGVFKVIGVVGHRIPVGLVACTGGLVMVGSGYVLGGHREIAGVAEATLATWLLIVLPFGLCLLRATYQIPVRDFVRSSLLPWAVRSTPAFVLAGWLGGRLMTCRMEVVAASTIGLVLAHLATMRPVVDAAPWPLGVRSGLARFGLARSPRDSG